MKKLLLFIFVLVSIILFISWKNSFVKNNSINGVNSSKAFKKSSPINIKDWQIDDATAAKLMENGRHPGNDLSSIVNYNDAVRNEILKAYPGGRGVWVSARYKDDDDEARYSRNWGIADDAGGGRGAKGRVKNYKTKIFVVTVDGNNMASVMRISAYGIIPSIYPTMSSSSYFDIAQICPPPDNCINN